jgi:hypothetical protein
MTTDEAKQQIRDNIQIKTFSDKSYGGQVCGHPYVKVELYSEDLNLKLECCHFANALKNRNFLMLLFDLAVEGIVCD